MLNPWIRLELRHRFRPVLATAGALVAGLLAFQNCSGFERPSQTTHSASEGPPLTEAPSFTHIPVLTYHSWDTSSCKYNENALIALEQDLNTIHEAGFTVVPAEWVAEWALGRRDPASMPPKPIAITLDDGPDNDWFDNTNGPARCAAQKSVRSLLNEFKAKTPGLPTYSPHATSFVVASPVARQLIGGLRDTWWAEAEQGGMIAIHNHSLDHDHNTITQKLSEPEVDLFIPAAGYSDGVWAGQNNFSRIGNLAAAHAEVVGAARYIEKKIGKWPRLFAYPFGHHSPYLENTYFPDHEAEHQTLAAYCFEGGHVTQNSKRYCLERWSLQLDWNNKDQLLRLINSPSVVQIYLNNHARPQWNLTPGTPFTLKYKSWGMDNCSVSATKNDQPWYTAPDNGANFDWGLVEWNETLKVTWTVTCGNSKGQTSTAALTLVMEP